MSSAASKTSMFSHLPSTASMASNQSPWSLQSCQGASADSTSATSPSVKLEHSSKSDCSDKSSSSRHGSDVQRSADDASGSSMTPFHQFPTSSKTDSSASALTPSSRSCITPQRLSSTSSNDQSLSGSSEITQQSRNSYQNESSSDSALREISSKMMSYPHPYMPTSDYTSSFGSSSDPIKSSFGGSQHSSASYLSKKAKTRSSTG